MPQIVGTVLVIILIIFILLILASCIKIVPQAQARTWEPGEWEFISKLRLLTGWQSGLR